MSIRINTDPTRLALSLEDGRIDQRLLLLRSSLLSCVENGSDKVYEVSLYQLQPEDTHYVIARYSRSNARTMQHAFKVQNVTRNAAVAAYNKTVSEKRAKGYRQLSDFDRTRVTDPADPFTGVHISNSDDRPVQATKAEKKSEEIPAFDRWLEI